jgi:predicted esterase
VSEQHHLRVHRTARYFTLGNPATAREVWFACHGYGQLAGAFIEDLTSIDDGSRYIVAPEALNRFYTDQSTGAHGAESKVGATWMTREDRLADIDDYVAYLDTLYLSIFDSVDRESVKVVALGFSQGAATVSRWAGMGAAAIDRAVFWGGTPAPDLEPAALDRLRSTSITVVIGSHDEFASDKTIERESARLRSNDINYELIRFDGGHRLDDGALRRIAQSL